MTDWDSVLQHRPRLSLHLPHYRRAAVLVPITARDELIFTVRSHDLPSHQGQISFPGGKVEADESLTQAALREADEEIGLKPHHARVLTLWDDTFTPAGNGFHVTPVLAVVPAEYQYTLSGEVAKVLTVPWDDLKNLAPQVVHRGSYRMYSYLWQGHDIWGMTGRILHGLLHPHINPEEL